MELSEVERAGEFEWVIPCTGPMRVPGVIYGSEALLRGMDNKVREQVVNVSALPGIERASYAMPDAHWGYGFPIGGVAAFGPDGVVSGGGVGFDISCGVRTLLTGLTAGDIEPTADVLAHRLQRAVPAGVGSRGRLHLQLGEIDDMLRGGGRWAVERGYGEPADLQRTEEGGCMPGAVPAAVSTRAKQRQQDEMGTLGSGNHYLEVQRVETVFDEAVAARFGLREDEVVVTIHCGSRGLGHQIGTEYLRRMVAVRRWRGREVVDELARRGIRVRTRSMRGVAEEAPGAYKDVETVIDAADGAALSRKVARLVPLICVKG